MRDQKAGRPLFGLLLLIFCLVPGLSCLAGAPWLSGIGGVAEATTETPVLHHETEGSYFLGYRWLELDDFERAGEYQYPHASVAGGFSVDSYPLPHRLHLNSEFLSASNYYGDIGYAYSDLLLFRNITASTWHNLDHYNYQYAGDGVTINPYDDRNIGDKYSLDVLDNYLTLRFKAPDFPFHTFLKHRYVNKTGPMQQRYLIGTFGAAGGITKTAKTREIDWKSDGLTLGANSHLGPLEAEYFCELSRFDPGGGNVMYEAFPIYPARAADTYPFSLVPKTESAANTLRLHTSYTGGLVAAATLSNAKLENNYSGAETKVWQGAFDLRWVPRPALSFFFKYRHRDRDADNPGMVTAQGLVNTYTYAVRQALSTKRDSYSISAKYKPARKITLLSTYEYEHLARKDVEQWLVLPVSTDTNHLNLTVDTRPRGNLRLKFTYDYKHFDNPANNSEPDHSDQLSFSSSYLPTDRISAALNYSLRMDKRSSLRYINSDPYVVVDGGSREKRNDSLLASLSFLLSPQASLAASWAYYRGRIEQDLAYGRWNGLGGGALPFSDPGVIYTDEANSCFLGLHYLPREDLTLITNINHVISKGDFRPGVAEAAAPTSIASFSNLKVSETNFTIGLIKKVQKDWEVGLSFRSNIYNDKNDNNQDGELYTSILSLKRQF